jgi:hypothetical protein
MSINIQALVTQAFRIAKTQAPGALPKVTLRVNPTPSVDLVADTSEPTWAITVEKLTPVAYASTQERENTPVEKTQRSFAFDRDAIGHPVEDLIDQTAEITEKLSGKTWNVYRVEADPTGSLIIFHASK